MNAKYYLTCILACLGFSSLTKAQSFACADFSVLGMAPDSLDSSDYQLSIEFSASANTFVNYPYVSAVLDCNGDTVATGGMFYFGQFGQTTVNYPVTAVGTPACEPLTAVFVYVNDSSFVDTCLLSFGGNAGWETTSELKATHIFPNPSSNHVNIVCDVRLVGSHFTLHDFTGKYIRREELTAEITLVDLSTLAEGVYLIRIEDQGQYTIKVIKE